MKAVTMFLLCALVCLFTSTAIAQPNSQSIVIPDGDLIEEFFILMGEGKYDDAVKAAEELLAEGKDAKAPNHYNRALRSAGRYDDALKAALKHEKGAGKRTIPSAADLAMSYLALEDYGKALEWLEQALNRGLSNHAYFLNPAFDPLREDERFLSLVQRVKDAFGIGKPAKDFTVETLSGESFTLSEQKGKVVLVEYWATWCPPCRAELPDLKKTYERYRDKGFKFIGLSLDVNEQALIKYVEENKIEWNIALKGFRPGDPEMKDLGITILPAKWLIDRQGILREGWDITGEDLDKAIQNLVNEQ